MAKHNVTLVTGDGTGPELAEVTRRVIDATGVDIAWDAQEAGVDVKDRRDDPTAVGTREMADAILPVVRKG